MIPPEEVLALARGLSRADQCRVMDALIVDMGQIAPVPAFESVTDEAEDWAALQTSQTKAAFLLAILKSLAPADREKALEWLALKATTPADGQRGLPEKVKEPKM